MLRIVSLNMNGLRSADRKGAFAWLATQGVDCFAVQEIKAQAADLPDELRGPTNAELPTFGHFHFAERPGYSGVGLYTRRLPDRVVHGIGSPEFDAEGRFIQADFGALSIVSLYLPSGSSSPERQAAKFRFLDRFFPLLERMAGDGREYVLCGDWNIAHKEIDLKNWRSNQKNSGFLPEERAWLGRVFEDLGWVDVFRTLDPSPERYTWWSNRGQAWAKNVGWRIDYQIATPGIAARARATEIYTTQRFSDHAPLIIDYDYAIGGEPPRVQSPRPQIETSS